MREEILMKKMNKEGNLENGERESEKRVKFYLLPQNFIWVLFGPKCLL